MRYHLEHPARLLLDYPDFPVPIGVLRKVDHTPYEEAVKQQTEAALDAKGKGDLETLLNAGDTWTVS